MAVVAITGSARGFGYAMLELFYKSGYNVVLIDVVEEAIDEAVIKLSSIDSSAEILTFNADITNEDDVRTVIDEIINEFGSIDIWINNAGVNQPDKVIWELDTSDINRLIDIDLKGTIICSKLLIPVMKKQGSGAIYNVEGHGSNDALITGLSIYGTAKRAVTYFTDAFFHEIDEEKLPITVGKITPGIMITNFITSAVGDKKIELPEKTKKVYNILGDYPETIAAYMVKKIINNKKKKVKFVWLTNRRAAWRFMSSSFNKRDFFK